MEQTISLKNLGLLIEEWEAYELKHSTLKKLAIFGEVGGEVVW